MHMCTLLCTCTTIPCSLESCRLASSEVARSRGARGERGLPPDPASRLCLAQALNQERQEKLALRKQLGQSPPKKGQGKRASKKK